MERKLRSQGHPRNHRAGRECPSTLRGPTGQARVAVLRAWHWGQRDLCEIPVLPLITQVIYKMGVQKFYKDNGEQVSKAGGWCLTGEKYLRNV